MNIVCCSDGGVINNIAGYSMVININEQLVIQQSQKLPNILNMYTSHQSKAIGKLNTLHIINPIFQIQSKVPNKNH
jgi:predicted KAP-like P-loop ATPase